MGREQDHERGGGGAGREGCLQERGCRALLLQVQRATEPALEKGGRLLDEAYS